MHGLSQHAMTIRCAGWISSISPVDAQMAQANTESLIETLTSVSLQGGRHQSAEYSCAEEDQYPGT